MAEPAERSETSSSSNLTSAQNSAHETLKRSSVPWFSGFPAYPNSDLRMLPVLYPTIVPGVISSLNQQQPMNGGAGIYAVPVPPCMGPIAGLPSDTLVPLTFSIPTTTSPEAGTAGDHGQVGQQPQHQQQAPARQVAVRRFQIAFQLDLFLIIKLAAVIFLFNQDGSRQRLIVLVLFASLVYLYQTGALTPLVRWLSQNMQRAAAPPQPLRGAARAEDGPALAAAEHNENVPLAEGEGEVENRAGQDGNQGAENENMEGGGGGNRWWGIVKEVQMIVFGFITSLLPGFHNID